jgi:hypothetical protein
MINKRLRIARTTFVTAFLLVLALCITGCTNHHLTKQMLLQQVIPEEELKKGVVTLYAPAGSIMIPMGVQYRANRLDKILCYNSKDQKVYVSVNQNTQLIVTDKKNDVHKFYLDTVYLSGDKMHGLRSRVMGLERSVPIEEIETIEVYTELSRETPAE